MVVAVVVLTSGGPANAEDSFPLTGNYTQNVACKGDGSGQAAQLVKLSPQEIVSNVGVCTILDTKQDGKTITAHVECKFPAGPLMGNISFTPRPDRTIDFVDREGNYKAVLHPCPN
jgi:hypothetical protein